MSKKEPYWLIELMLGFIEYSQENILNKKILDPEFGAGQSLKLIVERYIKVALKNGIDRKTISKSLQENIFGITDSEVNFTECLNSLELITKRYEIPKVWWNIYLKNNIKDVSIPCKIDYVICHIPETKSEYELFN